MCLSSKIFTIVLVTCESLLFAKSWGKRGKRRALTWRLFIWECEKAYVNIWCFFPILWFYLLLPHMGSELSVGTQKSAGLPTVGARKMGLVSRVGSTSPWLIPGLSSGLTLQLGNIAHFMLFSYLSCHIRLVTFFTMVGRRQYDFSFTVSFFTNHSLNVFKRYH